jgi:hypothetical protein
LEAIHVTENMGKEGGCTRRNAVDAIVTAHYTQRTPTFLLHALLECWEVRSLEAIIGNDGVEVISADSRRCEILDRAGNKMGMGGCVRRVNGMVAGRLVAPTNNTH